LPEVRCRNDEGKDERHREQKRPANVRPHYSFAEFLFRRNLMSRRLVIAGLVAAISLPALAQQQNQAIPQSTTPQPAETQVNPALGQNAQERQQRTQQGGAPQDTQTPMRQGQASAPAAMGQQQSQADRQYIQQMLALSTVSLQQSNFAHSKAQNPRVKQFSEFEIGEQNLLTEIMQSFADPNATASTTQGAQAAASTAPELPPRDAQGMERLSKAQAGVAFDKDYVALQIEGHQQLLKLQESHLQQASGNREMTNIAKLARGQIKEHLVMLQDIQKELGK
jgi:predicted outer membrane protein